MLHQASRPSLEEITDFWRYSFSQRSLREASAWIRESNENNLSEHQKTGLLFAAVVAYARPFTGSYVPEPNTDKKTKKLQFLDGVDPPTELRDTHQMLRTIRAKCFGHIDATPINDDDPINIVLINIEANDLTTHSLPLADFFLKLDNQQTQRQFQSLCDYYIAHCQKHVNAFVDKHADHLQTFRPGIYAVHFSEPPYQWLQPTSESNDN